MSTATPTHTTVICPVCWHAIPRDQWDSVGCCLTISEREEIR